MAKRLDKAALVGALGSSGLIRGDTVFVQSRMFSFGPLEGAATKEEVLGLHLNAFQEVLGPDGTLSVLTSFEDYGRYGTPYVVEESPSLAGVFSEYVMSRPGAVRSDHPIMSVTSIGARAQEISGGPHFEGLGYDSPWGRLHRINAKLLVYGGRFRDGMTFFHYIEAIYGVPYVYTKLYEVPVYRGGEEITGPFTLTVRYLDFDIANDPIPFETRLLQEGKGREIRVGRTRISVTTCDEAMEVGMRSLRENRYFFLKESPKFRSGEIPADGPTGDLQVSYNRAAERS